MSKGPGKGKGTGKAKGGFARKDALSPDERRDIAIKAAKARWGEKPVRATHKGNFKEDFGADVECYVLDDDTKTAVISQRGMGLALGLGEGGSKLTSFVRREKMAEFLGDDLVERLSSPLIFHWTPPGHKVPPNAVYGYDVTILVDICRAIVKAADAGVPLPPNAVKQANVVIGASAKSGIKGLVYALAGYDATRAEVVAAFKLYIREEAREYEKEFPSQLYEEWYRIYKLPKPQRNKPWKFKALTLKQVYEPLAHSNGKILALARAQKAKSAQRSQKLHQFLSEVGVKALRTHLGQLLGIAQLSEREADYEKNVERIFGRQLQMRFY